MADMPIESPTSAREELRRECGMTSDVRGEGIRLLLELMRD